MRRSSHSAGVLVPLPLVLAGVLLLPGCAGEPGASPGDSGVLDVVLAGGRVIDPESGLDAVRNVGLRGGEIVAITTESLDARLAESGERIDVSGLVVAPGFIDLHAHGQSPRANEFQVRDGVTTALELEWGYLDLPSWYAAREGKALVNYGASVAHGMVRTLVLPDNLERREQIRSRVRDALRSDGLLRAMQGLLSGGFYTKLPPENYELLFDELRRGLEEGALGIGMAHEYYPGANHEEIYRVFELAAEVEAPIYTHVRRGELSAIQEVVANATATGAALHIVHVNSKSLGQIDTVLALIEGARERGVDVSTEAYPYTAGSTSIQASIFDEGWQQRLNLDYGDIQWQETSERLTEETFDMLRAEGGTVIIHMMKPEWIETAMRSPFVMIASDGMPYAPGAHPRSAGTFSRVLGYYVREQGVLDLPTALRKMTLMPAQRLEGIAPQMARKGRVQVGMDADLTLFDPDSIIDTATFESDLSFSEGVQYVLVGGTFVVREGETVPDTFPGQLIHGRFATAEACPGCAAAGG
ncbi:MAG: amidohydrolase family protein [Acidobacteriota bacterium]